MDCPGSAMMFVSCGKGCHPTCADPSPNDCSDVCTEGCYCQPGAALLCITILMLLTLSKAMRNNLHICHFIYVYQSISSNFFWLSSSHFQSCRICSTHQIHIKKIWNLVSPNYWYWPKNAMCIFFTLIVNYAQNISCDFWDVCPNKPITQIIYETTI